MAQPSVAREPSMEEILASIRRIIENNDPVGPATDEESYSEPAAVSAPAPAYAESNREPVDPRHPVVADSMGVPLRAANSAAMPRFEREMPAEQPVAAAEKPQSLADIAARVRNAAEERTAARENAQRESAPLHSERRPSYADQAPQPVVYERAPVVREAVAEESLLPQQEPLRGTLDMSAPAFEPMLRSPERTIVERYELVAERAPEVQPEPVAAAPEPGPVAPEPVAVAQPEPLAQAVEAPIAAAVSAPLSLLSSEVGSLVARSFDELAEAVDGARRRSLDEIAEELLRPMLRDWLDDNLPTLVERLVREEIERVARGPRR